MSLLPVALALTLASSSSTRQVAPDRFEFASPLPGIAPVLIDKINSGVGVAQQTARSQGLQGRVLWVDCTANLDRYNTEQKIVELVQRTKDIGFNTLVLDIKPIVGYTIYPSSFTEKLTRWRDQRLPIDFDPVPIFVRECKRVGLSFMVSLNAFSEGHRMAKEQENNPDSPFGKAGPGYSRPAEQTVHYVPLPWLKLGSEQTRLTMGLNPRTIGPNEIGVYSQAPTVAGEMVILDSRGVVQLNNVPMPPGGRILVGLGTGAEFLRRLAIPGRRFEIVTTPSFQRADQVQNQIPLMMNPTHPAVRQRAIEFAKEVVLKYPVDGLLYDDRLRFGGVDADFSPETRAKFEEHVKRKLNWPTDVFRFTMNWDMERGVIPGPYWDRWFAWRALKMQTWVVSVRREIKKIRPSTQFGIYAGSWYGEYTKWGANYGRPGRRTPFGSASQGFSDAGFADQLDLFIAGCYYRIPTIAEALGRSQPEGRTVEAGAQLANRVIHDQAWTYAGIMLQDYFSEPTKVEDALQAAVAASQGVMVFDLSHRFDEFEPMLRRAFQFPARAPHQVNGLLERVRSIQAQRERMGLKEPPIALREGQPGVGH